MKVCLPTFILTADDVTSIRDENADSLNSQKARLTGIPGSMISFLSGMISFFGGMISFFGGMISFLSGKELRSMNINPLPINSVIQCY